MSFLKLSPESPEHSHLHSIRSRLLVPIYLLALASAAIALSGFFVVGRAVIDDAKRASHSLVQAAAEDIRGGEDPGARLPADSEWLFVDPRGVVLRGSPEYAENQALSDDALRTEILSRKDGAAVLRGADGRRRVYGFTPLRDGQSGYAVFALPLTSAFSEARSALISWLVIALGVGLVMLWAATSLADFLLVHRIHVLAGAMRGVAGGDPSAQKALVRGLGELDEVTDMFRAISGKFESTVASRESEVRNRTVALEFNTEMIALEKARTEALLTAVGDGLLAVDVTGKLTFMNAEAERMLGYSATDLSQDSVTKILRMIDEKGNAVPQEARPINVAMTTGRAARSPMYPNPYFYQRKDGTRFPAQITVTPVVVADKVAGVIQAFRDITAEMDFDRQKSEFVSIASHQLRSPLTAAKWLTDMLRKGDAGKLQPKQQEMADKLFDANERMVILVNELLNVSRLEAGTVKVAPEPCDLAAAIRQTLEENAVAFAQKKQIVKFEADNAAPVTIDRGLIKEVAGNLMSNASKYSPVGSEIDVGVKDRGEFLEVSVRDRGMGIPESDRGQMFRKFFRAENATQSVVTGTGLGLYFCKAIVELHGGAISYEAATGGGTVFRFTVPKSGAPLRAGEIHLT